MLTHEGEELVVVQPAKPSRRRRLPAGKPITEDDPLWDIVGMASSGGPGDVADHVDEHLAEAYTDTHP